MSAKVVLIASYPKSGNTWVRLFFESALRGAVSINDIAIGVYGFHRRNLFDSCAPAFAGDLTPSELENWLPDFFAMLASESQAPTFVKVHDSCRRTPDGRWLFPPDCVKAVIHLVRHPFDVAVSYAHHRGVSVGRAVADLCDENHMIADPSGRLVLPLMERAGSWSANAESWTGDTPYAVTTARYEDLCACPEAEFARLARAAGIEISRDDLARAVEAASFERLRAQETENGFRERPKSSKAFFRRGRPGSWRGELDEPLRARLVYAHGPAMRRFGYRDDS